MSWGWPGSFLQKTPTNTKVVRVDLNVVKGALADLERLLPGDAVPADFIDLGEEGDFAPEVMEGECSA